MAFEPLAEHPQVRGTDIDVHQFWGYQNVWTLRIPPWRCIYAMDGDEVVIIAFGHSDDVCARLHNLLPPEKQIVTRSALERQVSRNGFIAGKVATCHMWPRS
jgi:hypothetical protein